MQSVHTPRANPFGQQLGSSSCCCCSSHPTLFISSLYPAADEVKGLMWQLLITIKYLHSQHVWHRDMKSQARGWGFMGCMGHDVDEPWHACAVAHV